MKRGTRVFTTRKNYFVLCAILVSTTVIGSAHAMVPFYAQDWQCQIFDSNGALLEPEIARLINANAVIYGEGSASPGDAYFFAGNGAANIHYWGFSNLNFRGQTAYLDLDGNIMENEVLFYHSTDPASLTAWRRSADEVELHWTRDLRFVAVNEFSTLPPTSAIENYLIIRKNLADQSIVQFPVTGNTFLDTTVTNNVSFSYEILSLPSTGDTLSFSVFPDTAGAVAELGPHFWTDPFDYQERLYYNRFVLYDNTNNFTWPFVVEVDQSINPTQLALEVYKKYDGTSPGRYIELTGFEIGPEDKGWAHTWSTTMDTMLWYGGIYYRYRYVAAGDTIFCPAARGGRKHFFSSARNNRTMGGRWPEYLLNVEKEAWITECKKAAALLEDGVDSGCGQVAYNGIFLDTVYIMETPLHNRVRPYELVDLNSYYAATKRGVESVCDTTSSTFKTYINTGKLPLLEELDGYSGYSGSMLENFVKDEKGHLALANALWRVHGQPSSQTIFMNSYDFNRTDREQAIGTYFSIREAEVQDVKTLFGCGGWDNAIYPNKVNILPEQMLNVGDEIGSAFGVTIWPDYVEWRTIANLYDNIRTWLLGNTYFLQNVDGKSYAIREFELLDGIAAENSIITIWPFFEAGTADVSLGDLFSEKALGDSIYYKLDLEQERVLVTEGARIDTHAIPRDSVLTLVAGQVMVLFTAPVRSPTISEEPILLTTNPDAEVDIAVHADQWNGQPLAELRVSGSSLGFPEEMILIHDPLDDLYKWSGVSPGLLGGGLLPIVATGTDSLMFYGNLEVEVYSPEPPTYSERTLYALPQGGGESAVVAVEVRAVSSENSIVYVKIDASAIAAADSALQLNDSGYNEDQYPNDGIWSARVSDVNAEVGPIALPIEILDTQLNKTSGDAVVMAYVVEPLISQMCDVSSQTDQLKEIGGQPYSAVTLNLGVPINQQSDWGREDLFVTVLERDAMVYEWWEDVDDIPSFRESTNAFATGSRPFDRSRGLAVGDYNNDGYEDVFVAHESSPRLCRWDTTTNRFVNSPLDIVMGVGIEESALDYQARKSACAAWGDYNQDGWLDLIVGYDPWDYPATESGGGDVQTNSMPGGLNYVYTNHNGTLVLDTAHGPYPGYAYTVSWVDVNKDGAIDLFVGDFLSSTTSVYYNQGAAGGYAFSGDGSIASPLSLLSGEFADLDNDGDFDFVCAGLDATTSLKLFRTTLPPSGGMFAEMTTITEESIWHPLNGTGLNGAITVDLDLNGYLDVVTLPLGNFHAPQVLLNGIGGSAAAFSRSITFDSMEQGPLIGATAHDWNNDGDLDLFLGRAPVDSVSAAAHFFYQNRNAVDSAEELEQVKFVKVRLTREHFGNRAALGSTVQILSGDSLIIAPIQYVSGGDGRGGQRSRTLTFGLTDKTVTSVTARVTWPEGWVQEFPNQPINTGTAIQLTDSRSAQIDSSSMAYTKSAGIGYVDWAFIWESNVPLTNPYVVFALDPSAPAACDCSGSAPVSLTAESPHVSLTADTPEPGVFRYTLNWTEDWCCVPKCKYQFKVFGTYWNQVLESNWFTVQAPKSCVTGF